MGLIRQVVVSFKVNEATKQFLLCIFELFNRVIAMISGKSGRSRQSMKKGEQSMKTLTILFCFILSQLSFGAAADESKPEYAVIRTSS